MHDQAASRALDHGVAGLRHYALDLRQSRSIPFRHVIILHRIAVDAVGDDHEIPDSACKGLQVRSHRRGRVGIIGKIPLAKHSIGQHRCGAVQQIGPARIRHDAPRMVCQSQGALDGLKTHPAPVLDMPPDPPAVLLVPGDHGGDIVFCPALGKGRGQVLRERRFPAAGAACDPDLHSYLRVVVLCATSKMRVSLCEHFCYLLLIRRLHCFWPSSRCAPVCNPCRR